MTPQRWNSICNRWLIIVLIPLILIAVRIEAGSWKEAILVIWLVLAGFLFSAFVVGCFFAFRRDLWHWLKGY